jgi:hypothetical protein
MQSRKLTSLLLVAVLVTLSAVASAAPFNRSNYTPAQKTLCQADTKALPRAIRLVIFR